MKHIPLLFLLIFTFTFCQGQTLDNRIREIQKECIAINKSNTQSIDSIEINDESTDGGLLKIFRDPSGKISKMIVWYYGETGKLIQEYYLRNEKLFYTITQKYEYNRPYYWDAQKAKELGDSVAFDSSKSIIIENKYYFDTNENLVQWIDKDQTIIQSNQILNPLNIKIMEEFEGLKKR